MAFPTLLADIVAAVNVDIDSVLVKVSTMTYVSSLLGTATRAGF